jgi:hypothetical protein
MPLKNATIRSQGRVVVGLIEIPESTPLLGKPPKVFRIIEKLFHSICRGGPCVFSARYHR